MHGAGGAVDAVGTVVGLLVLMPILVFRLAQDEQSQEC